MVFRGSRPYKAPVLRLVAKDDISPFSGELAICLADIEEGFVARLDQSIRP